MGIFSNARLVRWKTKIGRANDCGAQLSKGRKAGAAVASWYCVKKTKLDRPADIFQFNPTGLPACELSICWSVDYKTPTHSESY
jgi:hypothetical protein